MDPIGRQKKIKDGEYHQGWQKLLDGGGAKGSYGHTKDTSSGTREADFKTPPHSTARQIDDWTGKTKGDTKHTYRKGGK